MAHPSERTETNVIIRKGGEMTDKETCPNAVIKGGRHCTCWPKEDCCACLEQPHPPIAEPAKAPMSEFFRRERPKFSESGRVYRRFCTCMCHRTGAKHVMACCLPDPPFSEWPLKAKSAPQPVIDDAQVEMEPIAIGSLAGIEGMESKPLPSEPQGVQLPDYIRRYGIVRDDEGFSTGSLVETDFGMYAGMIGVFRMAKELAAAQVQLSQIVAKPSEPAEVERNDIKWALGYLCEGVRDYLAVWYRHDPQSASSEANKLHDKFLEVKSVLDYSVHQAEKVEESWPEAVVSDEWIAMTAAFYEGKQNWEHNKYLATVLRELQTYRELKKRSVGGVK